MTITYWSDGRRNGVTIDILEWRSEIRDSHSNMSIILTGVLTNGIMFFLIHVTPNISIKLFWSDSLLMTDVMEWRWTYWSDGRHISDRHSNMSTVTPLRLSSLQYVIVTPKGVTLLDCNNQGLIEFFFAI